MRAVTSAEQHEVRTEHGRQRLLRALASLDAPFEVEIRPIRKDRATPGQLALWAMWMREMESETGHPRRNIERALLSQHSRKVEMEGKVRPAELFELSKEEASALMTIAQQQAAEAGIWLSSKREACA